MQPNRHKHADLVYIPTSHSPGTSGIQGCFTLSLRIRWTWQDTTGVQPVATNPLWAPLLPRTQPPLHQPSCFPLVCPLPGQWVQGRVCRVTLQDSGLGANERGCPSSHIGVSRPELGLDEPKHPPAQHVAWPGRCPWATGGVHSLSESWGQARGWV